MKLLIPVDGSERSHRAVQHVIDCFDRSRTTHVRLINVQPAIPFVRKWRLKAEDIRREQMRQGGKALRHAQALLDKAGIEHDTRIESGPAAETIIRHAKRWKCDAVIMGTRGVGATQNLVLGSVAMKVAQPSPCAVTLVN